MEEYTVPQRLWLELEAGIDAWGNMGGKYEEDIAVAVEAYNYGVERLGKEAADQIIFDSTRHILDTLFNVGVVDNPYVSEAVAASVPNNEEHTHSLKRRAQTPFRG